MWRWIRNRKRQRLWLGEAESAKRMFENNPAIYRLIRRPFQIESAKRTANFPGAHFCRPFHGLRFNFLSAYPALKCWATFSHPLCGLNALPTMVARRSLYKSTPFSPSSRRNCSSSRKRIVASPSSRGHSRFTSRSSIKMHSAGWRWVTCNAVR
jgi:hypothetical protein